MIRAECKLWGEKFSPALLREIPDIQIRRAREVGEMGKSGRYQDKPYPHGACNLAATNLESGSKIEWMADFVAANQQKFKVAGATRITFWIYWYGQQGNMELTVSELSKLAALQIPLCMDYIFVEEDQEP